MRWTLAGLISLAFAISASAQEPASPGSGFLIGAGAIPPARAEGKEREEAEPPEREEPIETDRDAFTPQTRTVEKGRSILEMAYSFIDNRRDFEKHSYPEMLYRYGLTGRVELRLGWNYEVGGSGSSISGAEGLAELEGAGVERASRLLYGFKAMVTDQGGWIPESCVLVQGFTPTSGKETDTQLMLGYVFGWKLPNSWKLDAALRYATATGEDDHFIIWAPSTVLRVPVGEHWGVHAEYFGEFAQQAQANFVHHFFSTGAHYLVTENLEIGVRVGWGLNDQTSRFFTNVGVGWRF